MIRNNFFLARINKHKWYKNLRFLFIQNFILFAVFLSFGCQNSSQKSSEYKFSSINNSKKGIAKDNNQSFDYYVSLSDAELKLEQKLFELRHTYEANTKRNNSPFFNKPFHDIKHFIDTTLLFTIFKTMPKGGLLHSHSGGLTNINWVITKAKEMPECYVYTKHDSDLYLFGQLGIYKKGTAPSGFISLKDKIDTDPSFETILYDLLVLKKESLTSDLDYWLEFEKRFMRIDALISYRPFFKAYYKKAFLDLLEDNVKHLEIRYIFGALYDFEKDNYSNDTIINDLNEVLDDIRKIEPDFSLGLIYTSFKFLSVEEIDNHLIEAFRLKKKYPELITGFDLVAEEDRGHSIAYYENNWNKLDSLKTVFEIDLPLYLHAGESNSIKNKNLYDAVLLDTKRIGHGLNLVLFPELIKDIINKDILIELSPISNQTLGYTPDLRTHPGRILLKNGVQCAISSDDPSVFGYEGISYDFLLVFLAWELDLKAVKKLVFNSINYASLNPKNKQKALQSLEKDWKHFVVSTNHLLETHQD